MVNVLPHLPIWLCNLWTSANLIRIWSSVAYLYFRRRGMYEREYSLLIVLVLYYIALMCNNHLPKTLLRTTHLSHSNPPITPFWPYLTRWFVDVVRLLAANLWAHTYSRAVLLQSSHSHLLYAIFTRFVTSFITTSEAEMTLSTTTTTTQRAPQRTRLRPRTGTATTHVASSEWFVG